jgi:hypothetical protein
VEDGVQWGASTGTPDDVVRAEVSAAAWLAGPEGVGGGAIARGHIGAWVRQGDGRGGVEGGCVGYKALFMDRSCRLGVLGDGSVPSRDTDVATWLRTTLLTSREVDRVTPVLIRVGYTSFEDVRDLTVEDWERLDVGPKERRTVRKVVQLSVDKTRRCVTTSVGLRRDRLRAAGREALEVVCWCAPESIPIEGVASSARHMDTSSGLHGLWESAGSPSLSSPSTWVDGVIEELCGCSLVSVDWSSRVVSVHRVVQTVVRDGAWMGDARPIESARCCALGVEGCLPAQLFAHSSFGEGLSAWSRWNAHVDALGVVGCEDCGVFGREAAVEVVDMQGRSSQVFGALHDLETALRLSRQVCWVV